MVRWLLFIQILAAFAAWGAQEFTVATWNLQNFILAPTQNRPIKAAESRQEIARIALEHKIDVLAVQELGGAAALAALQHDLKALSLKHAELVQGPDTNINIAILSRFPIVARRSQPKVNFALGRRQMSVTRGLAEVDIQVNSNYVFTLFNLHLKSRIPSRMADEAEIRLHEAMAVRRIIEERLAASPEANLIVAGDLNDVKSSPAVRAILGKRHRLLDLRPEEKVGAQKRPNVVWTYFWGQEDSYDRVDYLLLSRGIAREIVQGSAFVATSADWFVASDHRPVIVKFRAEDRRTIRD